MLPEIASFRHLLLLHLSASLRYPLLTVLRLKAVPVDRSSFTNTDRLELTTVNSSQLITVNGPSFNNRSSSIVQNPSSFFSLFYLLMLVQRVNYGEISVIPFIFPLYSHYYLLLLRANYETIILYNHMANVIKLSLIHI